MKDKRFMLTICNSVTSLAIFLVLFCMYWSAAGDETWQKKAPYEVRAYSIERSKIGGVFVRDKAHPVINAVLNSTKHNKQHEVGTEETLDAISDAIGCSKGQGSRCDCYIDAFKGGWDDNLDVFLAGNLTWRGIWAHMIDRTEYCSTMSANWEISIEDNTSKVLLGIVMWWAFSTVIVSLYLFLEWERDDWFYKGIVGLLTVVTPSLLACYVAYKEEGMTSFWLILLVFFILQHLSLKIIIKYAVKSRNEDEDIKQIATNQMEKKNVMASLTAFGVITTARVTQLFSGDNNKRDVYTMMVTVFAISLMSITLRLVCGALEIYDLELKKENESLKNEMKTQAWEYRKSLVFTGQWIWSLSVFFGLMLLVTMPVDSGDGFVEGSTLSKFSLALMVAALVLQYPNLTSSNNQWLGLQFIEGLARFIAFGTAIVYCVAVK